ncbi:DUF3089 domain-containing protein [Parvularcula sp. IMCC14364]|uniref:DUF3089 domain-containing protein n=1 Tax=Parvularcula sp. IMCC14364 TaxID=3067902 RepID=UPI002740B7C3|nr:DUF3089 domain-containing protein [Parvularcula sp. IMCC14364]
MARMLMVLTATMLFGATFLLPAQAAEEMDFERNDYSDVATRLCHPDKTDDACAVDLTTTIIASDGTTSIESFEAAEDPGIDCFYIYPTVSRDPTPNSDMVPGRELITVHQQFARFSEVCRPFAPIYRQMTLLALQAWMTLGTLPTDTKMRYADITDAWETYLRDHNNGRGVVLIGHSQGASMINDLLENNIIGTPAEKLIVSALPIGISSHIDRESGKAAGLLPCAEAGQTGCIISYVSFRETSPPPADSFFGETNSEGDAALCVNPAALSGAEGQLNSYLSAQNVSDPSNQPVFADGVDVATPFAAVPGLLSAACEQTESHTYLAISINADPDDPRTDDIQGDLLFQGAVQKQWGLHLIDMHLGMGNLIDIVRQQAEAWSEE